MVEIARGGLREDGFHLIYSMGALDRLVDLEARALLRSLIPSLAPDGKLWLSDRREAAYREIFMNDRRHARSSTELKQLALSTLMQPQLLIKVVEDSFGEFATLLVRST